MWAAFELDKLGISGEVPLAIVSREQLDAFALHTARLDPAVGPRILRILPFLGDGDCTAPDRKCRRLEFPTVTRPCDAGNSGVGTRRGSSSASGVPVGGGRPRKQCKIQNKKLAAGMPYLDDITVVTWNAQSLCCEDPNKFRRKRLMVKQLANHTQIIGTQETCATKGAEKAWEGPESHIIWW